MLHRLAQRARPQTRPAPGSTVLRPAPDSDLEGFSGVDAGKSFKITDIHGETAPAGAGVATGRRAWPHAWPVAAGLMLGLLALGPALARGFVLSYDLVFVPSPPVGYADLGLGGGPPRAVPSDLVAALAARIIPAELVEKLILIAIFVLACSGAAALLAAGWPQRPGRGSLPLLARLAAGVCYAWNPFVAERLIMGQWAMLLGYAGLPWVVREIRGREGQIRPWRLAAAICPGTGVAAVAGLGIAGLGLTAATVAAMREAIAFWPGFALLRDGQQFVAPAALAVSIGLGAGVGALVVAGRSPGSSRLIRGSRTADDRARCGGRPVRDRRRRAAAQARSRAPRTAA